MNLDPELEAMLLNDEKFAAACRSYVASIEAKLEENRQHHEKHHRWFHDVQDLLEPWLMVLWYLGALFGIAAVASGKRTSLGSLVLAAVVLSAIAYFRWLPSRPAPPHPRHQLLTLSERQRLTDNFENARRHNSRVLETLRAHDGFILLLRSFEPEIGDDYRRERVYEDLKGQGHPDLDDYAPRTESLLLDRVLSRIHRPGLANLLVHVPHADGPWLSSHPEMLFIPVEGWLSLIEQWVQVAQLVIVVISHPPSPGLLQELRLLKRCETPALCICERRYRQDYASELPENVLEVTDTRWESNYGDFEVGPPPIRVLDAVRDDELAAFDRMVTAALAASRHGRISLHSGHPIASPRCI